LPQRERSTEVVVSIVEVITESAGLTICSPEFNPALTVQRLMEDLLPIGLDDILTILFKPGRKIPAELTVLRRNAAIEIHIPPCTSSKRTFWFDDLKSCLDLSANHSPFLTKPLHTERYRPYHQALKTVIIKSPAAVSNRRRRMIAGC
jgi:hypothetical protein